MKMTVCVKHWQDYYSENNAKAETTYSSFKIQPICLFIFYLLKARQLSIKNAQVILLHKQNVGNFRSMPYTSKMCICREILSAY